jgi:hypothetical protein
MKNYKKLIIFLIILCIAIAIISFVYIYAKYTTSASSQTNMPIARWDILVNNISIKKQSDISATLIPTFPGNENIAEGIIAPTAEGYFDLNFDYTAVDVAFKYTISLKPSDQSSVTDIVATGYSIDDGTKQDFANFNEDITDTIPLDEQNRTRKIRIYVKWNDDDNTSTMDNSKDTESALSGNPALFDVNITFDQVIA